MDLGLGLTIWAKYRTIQALDRFGDRFRNRVFTDVEQQKAERRRDIAGTYANDGAAKGGLFKGTSWYPGCAFRGSHRAGHGREQSSNRQPRCGK